MGLSGVQERRRQRAVESLDLPERTLERLDRLARVARSALGVQLCAVTVLDGDRAFFPAAVGMDLDVMPREDTLCSVVVDLGQPVEVPDLLDDARFEDKPRVADGTFRFYAGRPLHDPSGNVVATFCAYDEQPRSLTDEQAAVLDDLAGWAQEELVASAESQVARQAQQRLLPAEGVTLPGWAVDGTCVPALAVGGDFYDFGEAGGVLRLLLGDVMGKGTSAALVGAGVRAALRGTSDAVSAGVDLGVTVTQTARTLASDLERTETFVTLFEAAVDLDDGHLRWVDAGSGLAVVSRADGSLDVLQADDPPLGVFPTDHWTEREGRLLPGDRLLVFSDGLLDVVGDGPGWPERVGELARSHDSSEDLLAAVRRAAVARTVTDDVTLVVLARGAEDPA